MRYISISTDVILAGPPLTKPGQKLLVLFVKSPGGKIKDSDIPKALWNGLLRLDRMGYIVELKNSWKITSLGLKVAKKLGIKPETTKDLKVPGSGDLSGGNDFTLPGETIKQWKQTMKNGFAYSLDVKRKGIKRKEEYFFMPKVKPPGYEYCERVPKKLEKFFGVSPIFYKKY